MAAMEKRAIAQGVVTDVVKKEKSLFCRSLYFGVGYYHKVEKQRRSLCYINIARPFL